MSELVWQHEAGGGFLYEGERVVANYRRGKRVTAWCWTCLSGKYGGASTAAEAMAAAEAAVRRYREGKE